MISEAARIGGQQDMWCSGLWFDLIAAARALNSAPGIFKVADTLDKQRNDKRSKSEQPFKQTPAQTILGTANETLDSLGRWKDGGVS